MIKRLCFKYKITHNIDLSLKKWVENSNRKGYIALCRYPYII